MSTLRFVQTPAAALYTGLSVSDTTMRITPYPVDLDGTQLTIADFGSTPTCTVDPKVSGFEEIIQFTGIVDNLDGTATLTGLTRDLTSKYPYTTSGTGKLHGSSAVVVFSDNPQVYNRLAAKENNETISGSWFFPAPTDPSNPARLSDLTGVVAGTIPGASSSVQGSTKLTRDPLLSLGTATITIASPGVISNTAHGLIAGDTIKLTTSGTLPTGIVAGTTYYVIAAGLTANAFEISSTLAGTAITTTGSQSGTHTLSRLTPFAIGDNDTRIPQNAYGVDAGSTDTYVITLVTAPTAYATGQFFTFKANTANVGAASLNVNSLGAKTIKNRFGNDLNSGDIVSGQLVDVRYDGTNFRLTDIVMPKFGGTGSDGALSVSSGTTNIDLGAARVVIKNYTFISITGTGKVTFSNAHASGTYVIIKSQGAVTLTSSQTPMLDGSGIGTAGGAAIVAPSAAGNPGTALTAINGLFASSAAAGGFSSSASTAAGSATTTIVAPVPSGIYNTSPIFAKYLGLFVGTGGGSGSNVGTSTNSGAGGTGGGCLIMECGGDFNFTTANGISVAGINGGNGSGSPASTQGGRGGGGGGGGLFFCLYNSLIANSGTVTVTAGTGGNNLASGTMATNGSGGGGGASGIASGSTAVNDPSNGTKTGGDGGAGFASIMQNSEFA